jgi:hypothetical protein
VPCWKTEGELLGLRISYQRTPVTPPLATVWLAHNDSVPPRLRYCSCIISRSPSVSSVLLVPPCGTFVLVAGQAKLASARLVGPVRVELSSVVQFTWNCHRCIVPGESTEAKISGSALGGCAPRMLAGSRL